MENKRKTRIVRKVLLLGIAVCLIKTGQIKYLSIEHRTQQNTLKKMTEDAGEGSEALRDTEEKETDLSVLTQKNGPQVQDEKEPVILARYAALYEENNDLAGWLSIEGTEIDYPVMQCEDDEYYLHHDFYGEESKYGCLYVKEEADIDVGTNFIIYGHNMKDGSMFGELDLYEKESFYEGHPVILFDTLYEERIYEIIAVFPSQVYNVEDDVFKYYQFYKADNEAEFNDFYSNIRKLSLYDTGVEAVFGDTFLTLSTCAYHVEDGRFVIVAKRITDAGQ